MCGLAGALSVLAKRAPFEAERTAVAAERRMVADSILRQRSWVAGGVWWAFSCGRELGRVDEEIVLKRCDRRLKNPSVGQLNALATRRTHAKRRGGRGGWRGRWLSGLLRGTRGSQARRGAVTNRIWGKSFTSELIARYGAGRRGRN